MGRLFQARPSDIASDQTGAASIYVSLIIMVILSLSAFGLARIAGTNYQQIAESQANLQAQYAAESAINDVRSAIHESVREATQVAGAGELSVVKTGANNWLDLSTSAGFGTAVFRSGNLLFVGAPAHGNGALHVLEKDNTDPDWSSPTTSSLIDGSDVPSPGLPSGARFGSAAALGHGQLLVGAPGAGGAVYIFSPEGAFIRSITAADVGALASHEFGTAVAFYGSAPNLKILVGAPGANSGDGAVYVLRQHDGSFEEKIDGATIAIGSGARFGSALSSSQSRLAVGAPGWSSGEGAVYVLERGGSGWLAQAEIYNRGGTAVRNNLDLAAGDSFGTSVSIQGSLLAAGAPGDDGGSPPLSNSGAVHVFERKGSGWDWSYKISASTGPGTQFNVPTLAAAAAFGQSVALRDNLLTVGTPGQTRAYFFRVSTNDILNDIWAAGLGQDCLSQDEAHPAWRNGMLLPDADIEYLCVSAEVAPQDLIYDKIDPDRSLNLTLEPVNDDYDDVNLEKLILSWDHADLGSAGNLYGGSGFASDTVWGANTVPVLKVQVILVNTDRPFTRQLLNQNSRVFFLYPNTGTANTVDWRNADGRIVDGHCVNTDFTCSVIIDLPSPTDPVLNVPSASAADQLAYRVRIQSIYNEARIQLAGEYSCPPASCSANFKNMQAIITATGKSGQVGQRLSERIPLRPIYDLPEYAIDSAADLCKILSANDDAGVYLSEDQRFDMIRSQPSCSLRP